ncbi:hypothetical protein WH47_10142 [Habropoda laboriosa]|uniref:Uncharacterized protein n=1 Tax=Habropoda laboriosa TaxID=597456 RepID=A0A0L7R467_9HYME|nr:hypothetical protein WH47_10142 [Habropoda laboriosa]
MYIYSVSRGRKKATSDWFHVQNISHLPRGTLSSKTEKNETGEKYAGNGETGKRKKSEGEKKGEDDGERKTAMAS